MTNLKPLLEKIRDSEFLVAPNHLQYGIGNTSIPIEDDLDYLMDKLSAYNESGQKEDLLTFTRHLLVSFDVMIDAHLKHLYDEKYGKE
jgi:hypothetical protein